MRNITKSITFDRYDTLKLKDALKILTNVYEYNFDASRKTKLLETIIKKLENLLDDCGEN